MSRTLKIMLLWTIIFPIGTTSLIILIDYVMGKEIELLSYSAQFAGFLAGGLLFGGPLNVMIAKSEEE